MVLNKCGLAYSLVSLQILLVLGEEPVDSATLVLDQSNKNDARDERKKENLDCTLPKQMALLETKNLPVRLAESQWGDVD